MKKFSEVSAVQWVKLSVVMVLYILFLIWVKSWL